MSRLASLRGSCKGPALALALAALSFAPEALGGGAWTPPAPPTGAFGVPRGDAWRYFQCTNGERTLVAAGGVMERLSGLSLLQCVERCSRTTGCVGVSYVGYVEDSSARYLDQQCTLLGSYVGRTGGEMQHSGGVTRTTFVCFTDRYRRDKPWNEADLLAVPDGLRAQLRPDVTVPGAGAPPRGGKYP